MVQIKYSLISEGSSDWVLRTIVERYAIFHNFDLVINESLSKPFNGPLGEARLRIRTRSNFDSDAVELGLYFTDKDKDREGFDKLKFIEDTIRSVQEVYLTKSVTGIPDPHLEAWLLSDQNAVKKVFGLRGEDPIPFSDRPPKSQLESLANTCGGDDLTPPEARKRLAEELDLSVLERNSQSFNQFIHRLKAFLNTQINQ